MFFVVLLPIRSIALDAMRCAVLYPDGVGVTVEVQLYDFGTSTNVYPGAGNQNLGTFTSNSSGVISFIVGEDDVNWSAVDAGDVTNNYMLIVYIDGAVSSFLELDELAYNQGLYGTSIGTNVFDTENNVTSNRLGTMASDDFVFGSDGLDDDGNSDHDARFFFDKSKAAFRAGAVDSNQWDDSNIGLNSFAAGINNTASGEGTAIGGGTLNEASDEYCTVGGGYNNVASSRYATVGGGFECSASDWYTTVAGGYSNSASYAYTAVGGGLENIASALYSAISGGTENKASDEYSFVGGGYKNHASGSASLVTGGEQNNASGDNSIVLGGHLNTASGEHSVVLGGTENTANGYANMVFGHYVDPSVTEDYRIYFFSGSATHSGMLGVNRENINYPIHVGTDATNGNGAHLTAGGTWTNGSSITFKDRFAELNDDYIINSILKLPVKSWYYKGTDEMHIGPFAEDFHKIFGTGDRNSSDIGRYLSTIDVAGVSLRGVQILISEIEELKSKNSYLKEENDDLRNEIEDIKQKLSIISKKLED